MNPVVNEHALINNTRIAYGVHGAGEPVVMLHGTSSSSLIWRDVLPRAVQSGFQVHLFDLLGYGLSERPWNPAIDASVSAQVEILEGMLGHWGLKDAHIISHDIGGAIAQRFAVFSPQRTRSLTLIDVVSFDSWPSKRTHEQMQAGLDALINAPDNEHRAHFKEWLLSTVQNKARFEKTSLNTFLDYISNPIGQGSLFQHQVRHYDPKHTAEIADRLGELENIPTQIIWGENDGWQVVDWARKLQAAIPNSELHILKDCGHFAMEDQPEKIAELLVSFLNKNRR